MIEELLGIFAGFGGERWGACLMIIMFFAIGAVSHRSDAGEEDGGERDRYEETEKLLTQAVERFKKILRRKKLSSSQPSEESTDAPSTSGSEEKAKSNEEQDFEDDNDVWRSDSDLLEDESIPIDEKVAQFRERFNDSDESARIPLVKSLIVASRNRVKRDEDAGFRMLDEAKKLLDESEFSEGEEYEIAQTEILMHRVLYCIGLDRELPFEYAGDLRDHIRQWDAPSDSIEANVCLLRAWIVHAQALLYLGASSSSMTSFKNALGIVDEMKDRFGEDVEKLPDVPFLLTAYGRACETSGDVETAIKSYRSALKLFFSFRAVPPFLTKSARVNEMLVNLLTAVGRFAEAKETAIKFRRKIQKIWRENRVKTFTILVRALLSETNVYSKNGDFPCAIQSLKKAERTLLQGIRELRGTKSRRRVSLARKMLVDVYSLRASLFFAQREFDSAWKDYLDGLRWFNKALAKNDSINLEQAFVCFFALAFNFAETGGKWSSIEGYEKRFRRFLSLVPSEKFPVISKVVSDVALNLHRINHLQGKPPEAKKWIDVAVDAMTKIVETDDEISTHFCFVLVKNLMQRSVFSFAALNDSEAALADLERVGELFRDTELSTLVGGNYEATECYLEFLRRYACLIWRDGDREKAVTQIKKLIRVLKKALTCGNITVLREIKEIVPIAARFAAESEDPLLFFRSFRFWSRYVDRVRVKILKVNLSSEVREQIERDFTAVKISLLDSRIQFLESHEGCDDWRRFISEADANKALDAFNAVYGAVSERVEETTKRLGLSSFNEFVDELKSFVLGELIKSPRDFLLWNDLQTCSRLIEGQIREAGFYGNAKLLSYFSSRLSNLYWSHNKARLAFTEICYTKDVVEAAAIQRDSTLVNLIRADVSSTKPADESDDADKSDNSRGIQKLLAERASSVRDSVFWNAIFIFWQTYLIAFERFAFGKESSLIFDDYSIVSWREAYGGLLWLKQFSEDSDESSDSDEADADDESTIEEVSVEDYRLADEFQKRFFDRLLEVSRSLGRRTVLRDFSCVFQYKNLYKLLFVWRNAWNEASKLKKEIWEDLDSFERNSHANLNLQTFMLGFCESLADLASELFEDNKFAIELHERLVVLAERRFPLAACFMAIRDGFFPGNFYMKLALKADENGNVADELFYLFQALDDCAKAGVGDERHIAFFAKTTNVLCELFFKKDPEELKIARKFILRFEKAFDVVFSKLKERSNLKSAEAMSLLQAAWQCFIIVGIYYGTERRCFYLAKTFFDRAWLILETLFFDSDDPTRGIFFSVFMTDPVAFDFKNGLVERATRGGAVVATLCRLFLDSDFSKERVQLGQNRQIQDALLRMNMSLLSNAVFYASASVLPDTLDETLDDLQTRPEYVEFGRQKRRGVLTSSPFAEKNAGEDEQLSEEAFRIGGAFFIASELRELTKVDEIGFDRVKRSVKALGTKLRKTCLKQSEYELEFEYNWVRFACVKQEWKETYRSARRLLKRFFSPNSTIQKGVPSDFRRIHVELLKIETFCILRSERRRDAVRSRATLESAFQLFDADFKERRFEVRTLFPELLTLRAWRQKLLGKESEALEDAERAARLFARFEKRGFSNWLPEIRATATSLVDALSPTDDEVPKAG